MADEVSDDEAPNVPAAPAPSTEPPKQPAKKQPALKATPAKAPVKKSAPAAAPAAPAPAPSPAPAPAPAAGAESDDDLEDVDASEDPFKNSSGKDATAVDVVAEEEEDTGPPKPSEDAADEEDDDDEDGAIQSTMETRSALPTAVEMPSVLEQEAGARGDARERLINGDNEQDDEAAAAAEMDTDLVDTEYVNSVSFRLRSHGKDNQAIYMPDVEKIVYCRSTDRNGEEIKPFQMPSDKFCDQAGKRQETTQWLGRTYGENELSDSLVIMQSSVPSVPGSAPIKYAAYTRVEVVDFHKGPSKLEADIKDGIGLFPLHHPDASKLIKKQQSRVPRRLHASPGKIEYMIIAPKNEAQVNDKWTKVVAQKPPAADRGRKRKTPAAVQTPTELPPDAEADAPAALTTEADGDDTLAEDGDPAAEDAEEEPAPEAVSAPAPTAVRARPAKTPRHEPPNPFTCPPPSALTVPSVEPPAGTTGMLCGNPVTTVIYGNPHEGRMEEFSVKEHKPVLVIDVDQSVDPSQGQGRGFSIRVPEGCTRIVGQLRIEL